MAVAISHAQGSSPGVPQGDRVPSGQGMSYVHLLPGGHISEHGVLHTWDPSSCPGCPAHFRNVQLGANGAAWHRGYRQATKRSFTRRGGPSKAPLKLRHHRKSARPCLRDTVQLPKGLFLFFALNTKITKISL